MLGPQRDRDGVGGMRGELEEVGEVREELTALMGAGGGGVGGAVEYETEISRLRGEVEYLKDIVQRQSRELKNYQSKYGLMRTSEGKRIGSAGSGVEGKAGELGENGAAGPGSGGGAEDGILDFQPWLSSADVMGPLLIAYDSQIMELRELCGGQKSALESVGERVNRLVKENEELRQLHAQNVGDGGFTGGGGDGIEGAYGGIRTQEMMRELEQQNDTLLAETRLMAEQVSRQAAEFRTRLGEAIADKEACEKQVVDLSNGNSQLRVRLEQLDDEARQAAASYTRKLSSLEESLRRTNAARAELEQDLHSGMQRLRAFEERIRELQLQHAKKSSEGDAAQELVRKLTHELENTRQDAEGMIQVMASMEKQIAEFSARRAQVEKQAVDSQEHVEKALLDRDLAKEREEQARRELARTQEQRKQDIDQLLMQQEAAVEAGRAALQEQLETRTQELNAMVEHNAVMRAESERATREKRSAEALFEQQRELLNKERLAHIRHVEDFERRMIDAVREKEEVDMQIATLQRSHAAAMQDLDEFKRRAGEAESALLREQERGFKLAAKAKSSQREAARLRKRQHSQLIERERHILSMAVANFADGSNGQPPLPIDLDNDDLLAMPEFAATHAGLHHPAATTQDLHLEDEDEDEDEGDLHDANTGGTADGT